MNEWFSSLWLCLWAFLRRRDQEQDLRDEIAFHLAMREAQLRVYGDDDAQIGARRRFGNRRRIEEEMNEIWALTPRLGSFAQDVR